MGPSVLRILMDPCVSSRLLHPPPVLQSSAVSARRRASAWLKATKCMLFGAILALWIAL